MSRKNPTKVGGDYSSGISIPFRGDGDGGLALDEGDPYIRSLVLATVSPNMSENPFQDLGSDESAIFQNPDDPDWRRVVRRRIERQFRELDDHNLARLIRVNFGTGNGNGELRAGIEYINLESTVSSDIQVQLQSGDKIGVAQQVPGGTTRSG